jgi:tetratricopeptide (TPR) repeat protein
MGLLVSHDIHLLEKTLPGPEFNKKLEEGVQAFYQTEWGRARKIFDELKSESPSNPMPYFFESMMPFWEYFFVNQTEELATEFLEKSEKAIELSNKRLDKVPGDTTMVMILSGLHGYRSLVAAGESNYKIAIRSSMTGFSYTRKLLSLDSDRPDAKIGRGMYYYMLGSVPKEMKWVTNIAGLKGDIEMGLSELTLAAQSDSYVRHDAKMILMYLLNREEKYEEALVYAEKLTKEFPENVIFIYKKAEIYEKLGKMDLAKDQFTKILELDNKFLREVTNKSSSRIRELEELTLKN